jgi:Ni/Co efflux regulator RcnB
MFNQMQGLPMKRKLLLTALTAASLVFAGTAMAQDRDARPGPGGPRAADGPRGPGMEPGRAGRARHRGPRHMMAPQGPAADRGAGPERDMHVGDRLPVPYRGKGYIVEDWRGHGLSAPPRGQHWVQTGGDYVLVVASTGKISAIALGR